MVRVCLSGAGQLLSTGPWLKQTSSLFTLRQDPSSETFRLSRCLGEHELTWM